MFYEPRYVFGDQNIEVPAHLNFGKFIFNNLLKFSDEIALINAVTDEKLTYKQFIQHTVDLAVFFYDLGVKKGDIVAIGSEKRNEFMPALLAIILTGAIYTPIDNDSKGAIMKHKFDLTKPKFLLCSNSFWKANQEVMKTVDSLKTYMTFDQSTNDLISVKEAKITNSSDLKLFKPMEVKGVDDIAFVLYSSGTTGLPKGVLLSHLNCILTCLDRDNSLKIIWMYGMWDHNYDIFMTLKFLILGRTLVYNPETGTSSIRILEDIQNYKANLALFVPSSFNVLVKTEDISKYKLDSLKVIYSRSAPIHHKVIEKAKNRLPKLENILQGYGMTEAGEPTSEVRVTKGLKVGSVGMPGPGFIMKVVDVKTRETLGPNEKGEICLRGPGLMKGYIGAERESYLDEDGFFKTGDLGYYDEDNYFFIVDRLKEIIHCDGYKIAPLELEMIILMHPEVKDVGVVGKPDPDLEEVPAAFVVRQPDSTVTEQDIVDFVAKEVSFYMELRGGVRFIEEIPRNPRRKIMKKRLREMLTE